MRAIRPSCMAIAFALALGLALSANSASFAQNAAKKPVASKKTSSKRAQNEPDAAENVDRVAAHRAPVGAGDPAKLPKRGPYRKLAPGVEKTIDPERHIEEAFSRHDMVEILASDPEFGERSYSQGKSIAKDVVFQHDIWALDFTFKPVRMIEVDVPDPEEGHMVRKLIWYLVYHVRNNGKLLKREVSQEDATVTCQYVDSSDPVRFIPEFVLESWDTGKKYPDRLIPVAIDAIQLREDANREFLDSVGITGDIPVSSEGDDQSVWGVATWEDIDPATDHFSVYVKGLTNAYRWTDEKSGTPAAYTYKAGEPVGTGRTLTHKTLRLNFWRPSDRFYEHDGEIRFGYFEHKSNARLVVKLKPEEKVDYRWDYR